jgi:hypothetical protein
VLELAVIFLFAAALVLVPLLVAGDLWSRARSRGRLPSPAAMATIAFGIATCLSNGEFVFRVLVRDGAGVTGLSIVTALWATMALMAIWIALRTQRVRLYAARADDTVLATPPASLPAAPAASRIVYRDDLAPDQPCATPLRATQLPPTIRDIVRAEARQARASTLAATVSQPAVHASVAAGPALAADAPVPQTSGLPPDALAYPVTPRIRFPVRGMAETGRAASPRGFEEPAFRSTRRWDYASSA